MLFNWIEWLKAEPKLRLDAGGDSSNEAVPCITPKPQAETPSAPAASKHSGMFSQVCKQAVQAVQPSCMHTQQRIDKPQLHTQQVLQKLAVHARSSGLSTLGHISPHLLWSANLLCCMSMVILKVFEEPQWGFLACSTLTQQ